MNLVKDSTGVEAHGMPGTHLQFKSTDYGTDALVQFDIVNDGTAGTSFTNNLMAVTSGTGTTAAGKRATGLDVVAKVNGYTALGRATR